MHRVSSRVWVLVLAAPVAYSQSDEELLEIVRNNGAEIAREQASWTLPESFHTSGLAPSDKERLIEQWSAATGTCLAKALAEYSKTTETALSEMVNDDGSFSLKGDGSYADFDVYLNSCIERAWAAIGATMQK